MNQIELYILELHGSIDRSTKDIEQLGYLGELKRKPAFFPIIIYEYTSSDSSVSSRDLSPVVSGTETVTLIQAHLNYL